MEARSDWALCNNLEWPPFPFRVSFCVLGSRRLFCTVGRNRGNTLFFPPSLSPSFPTIDIGHKGLRCDAIPRGRGSAACLVSASAVPDHPVAAPEQRPAVARVDHAQAHLPRRPGVHGHHRRRGPARLTEVFGVWQGCFRTPVVVAVVIQAFLRRFEWYMLS